MSENNTYSILELNTALKSLINTAMPGYVWVRGEIQDYETKKFKKHIFFNLVEKDPTENIIVAQTTCVIFENVKAILEKRIRESGSDFAIKEDIEVKFLCRVDLYPKAGQVRLIVADIDPVHTAGKIALQRQRIINELKEKGLVEKNKSNELSLLPLNIGLITSDGSAAYHDFTNELQVSGLPFKLFLYDCRMQGKEVEGDCVAALDYFNALADGMDVIVISRGGGSTSDLSWFDNKVIAQKIAESKFPVVSALGHEINTTITDLVAHTSVKTPTKAAQFLVERCGEFLANVGKMEEGIMQGAKAWFNKSKERLKAATLRLDSLVGMCFKAHHQALAQKKQTVMNCPALLIREREKIKQSAKFILPRYERAIGRRQEWLKFATEKIKILDPENILRRGYSIVYKGEVAVKSVADVHAGDIVNIKLRDGKVVSKVERFV